MLPAGVINDDDNHATEPFPIGIIHVTSSQTTERQTAVFCAYNIGKTSRKTLGNLYFLTVTSAKAHNFAIAEFINRLHCEVGIKYNISP